MKPIRRTTIALAAFAVLGTLPAVRAGFDEGVAALKAGKWAEAAAEFQTLVDNAPEYDFGYYALGLSFLKMGKLEQSEENFRLALDLNPDKFEYHHGLAKTLMERAKFHDVVEVLGPAEGLAGSRDTRYAFYSMRGSAYARQKKWSEAIEDLEKARGLKSSHPILVQLGKAYFALGYHEKAAPIFRDALKENAKDPGTQRLFAEGLIELAKGAKSKAEKGKFYGEAVQAAEQYRSLSGGDWKAENLVGKASLGARDYDKAAAAFQAVLKKNPGYCYAMINLGKTRIAQEAWAVAEKPLRDAAKCSPREPMIYESLGLVYQKRGKAAQEAEDYDTAKKLYADAISQYDRAAAIKPSAFVDKAKETIQQNFAVIDANIASAKAEKEQEERIRKEEERLAEEERKRREWQEKQKRDQ